MMRGLRTLLICLLAVAPASVFGYSVDLSIEPVSSSFDVNTDASFQIWLRNIRLDTGDIPDTLAAISIRLNPLPEGFSYQPGIGGDGFDENDPPIGTELDYMGDGQLYGGDACLAYSMWKKAGIPITGVDRMLGTFVVQATLPGDYTLSIDSHPVWTRASTYNGQCFDLSLTGADVTVTPEPATCLLGLGSLVMMLGARRKLRKKEAA